MKKERPKNWGTPFKKGQSGNPSGKQKIAPEILEIRKVNRQTFEEKLQQFLRTPLIEIETMLEDYREARGLSLDLMVASIIKRAVVDGCVTRMNFLLNRMGVATTFEEHDPTLNVTPQVAAEVSSTETAPFFVVEINSNGKFTRARPRELLSVEKIIQVDATPQASNG
jgi:hypothetical protein